VLEHLGDPCPVGGEAGRRLGVSGQSPTTSGANISPTISDVSGAAQKRANWSTVKGGGGEVRFGGVMSATVPPARAHGNSLAGKGGHPSYVAPTGR
jgi:hypothetical protein